MRKKVALTVAAVAMVGTLAVGGTLAWFTDTETATNVVTTGNVDIAWWENGEKITDKNPGVEFGGEDQIPVAPGATLQKEALVRNEGKNAALIRAKVEVDTDVEDIVTPEYFETDLWQYDEETGYYYYLYVVNPDGETVNLITDLTITGGNEIADIDEAKINLVAEAIQADNIIDADEFEQLLSLETVKAAFEGVTIESYDTETEPESVAETEIVAEGMEG